MDVCLCLSVQFVVVVSNEVAKQLNGWWFRFVRLVSYFHSIAIAWPFWFDYIAVVWILIKCLTMYLVAYARSYLVISNMRRDVTIFHLHIYPYTMNAKCNFHISNTMSYIIKWVSCWIPAPAAMQWKMNEVESGWNWKWWGRRCTLHTYHLPQNNRHSFVMWS